MNKISRHNDRSERSGVFLLTGIDGRLPPRGTVGLIGFELTDGWSGSLPPQESEEAMLWDAWLARTLGDGSVRFGDRLGPHLWLFVEIPDRWRQSSENYLDGLARRIQESMTAETGEFFPGLPKRGDNGYGAAVVQTSAGRPFKEALYGAFLAAASRLHGWRAGDSSRREEMERILHDKDIRSVYQPLFQLKNGGVFGYEALTRCPAGNLFEGPLALFRYAEKEGYSFALDRLAREKAIRSCPILGPKQKIFINVHSGIMKDPHFVSGQTLHLLTARGMVPGQVVLELTERSSIDDFEEAKRMLDHYRSQGYEIAIDDAGAGYSSLQAIVELRPDYIKLDKSLVQNADRDEIKKHMLRTFVKFAKRMKIRTVAEGIERPEELQLVRSMGIDFGQGYLIGRPSESPALTFAAGVPNG